VHSSCLGHCPTRQVSCLLFYAALFLLLFRPCTAADTEFSLSGDKITLHVRDVPLVSILRELVRQGITVRLDPRINPKVTASLDDQDLRQGLDSILQPYSYALSWKSGTKKTSGPSTLAEVQVFIPGNKEAMRPLTAQDRIIVSIDPKTGSKYVRGQILVQVTGSAGRQRLQHLLKQVNGTIIRRDQAIGLYKIQVPAELDIPALTARINTLPELSSEPDFVYSVPPLLQLTTTQDEADQQQTDISPGTVPVAILDSGLRSGLGLDSLVVTSLDSVHPDAPLSDSMGHGTQMALIATGMITPDGAAAASEDKYASIIPIKIFDDQGLTSNFTLIQSINFALNNGARVISLSWGTETDSDFLRQTMDQATSDSVVILAAAGNQATGKPVYPAAYDSVIGVGALTADGKAWKDSNYGSSVSISAPGIAAFPTEDGQQTLTYAGTSISTAYTARKVADFLSSQPQATISDVYTFLGLHIKVSR
jgi:hypothetical protein